MKKILLMIPHLNKGGAERVVMDLANYLSDDFDITILIFTKGDQEKFNVNLLSKNVKIKYLFNWRLKFQSLTERFYNKLLYLFSPFIAMYLLLSLKKEKFDIIHSNLTIASLYNFLFKILSKTINYKFCAIETFHTNWFLLKWYNKIIFSLSWRVMDKIVWEIGNEEKTIQKYAAKHKVHYIPFSVASAPNLAPTNIKKIGKRFQIPQNKTIIGTISRLRLMEKRIDKMLEVIKYLNNNHDQYHLVLFGDGSDRKEIERLINQMGINNQCTITGYVDNPEQIVNLIDIYLVAMVGSYTGVSGLQAGKAGIPCFGIQLLKNYRYADDHVLFSSSDAHEISDKILKYTEARRLNDYSKKFTNHIDSYHKPERFREGYLKIYNES